MSCIHYEATDSSREINYSGVWHPHYRYPASSWSPRIGTPESNRSARGDPPYVESGIQDGRIAAAYKHEARHGDSILYEKLQGKLKFLEDSNIVMQTRNQNLIRENKGLVSRHEEGQNQIRRLEKRIVSLEEELDREKSKSNDMKEEVEKLNRNNASSGKSRDVSTTNIISKVDRGIQIWAVCKACQRKLESCEKLPPTVTITKSELEFLEKDMQTLRDTIIAREKAWDKAMEREENYRQQLTRLTTEAITARHLSETRNDELQAITNTLTEKEAELKSLQKDNLSLNKLVAKLHSRHLRGIEDSQGGDVRVDVNEKEQKVIEEIVRRVSTTKNKQKSKPKSGCSERTPHSIVSQNSPRDSKSIKKDQTSGLKDSRR